MSRLKQCQLWVDKELGLVVSILGAFIVEDFAKHMPPVNSFPTSFQDGH
jgi:hypothetical protein